MNRQARGLWLLALLLVVVLTTSGVGAWADAANAVTPVTAPSDDESAMPPLEGGAPRQPDGLVTTPSGAAGHLGLDFQDSPNAPVINVWYGATQAAGLRGDPQKWVNILGNVSSAVPITSLTYTLNGGPPQNLSRGPDNLRLAQAGDFNIELDYTDLLMGSNQVVITALDSALTSSQAVVTVNYSAGPTWTPPQNITVNWGAATKVTDVAQVVDGQWTIDNGAARPTVLDFDRLLAIGDLSWRDYTVTVPITILAVDPSGYTGPSNGPGVGVMVRWQGHYWAENDTQPRTGWRRLGALAWYRWKGGATPSEGLQLVGHRGNLLGESARTLSLNTPYIFKVSITSSANSAKPATYRFKVWEASQAEPATWDFEQQGNNGEPKSGAILLVAHHVDARFGNVTVNLASVQPKPTLTVNATGTGTGTIDVSPQKQSYRFGEDVSLTVTPAAGSTFQGWLGDLSGNANPAALEIFGDTTAAALLINPNVQTPISDDFSGCQLNPQLWAFVNPLGDAELSMTGSQVQISIPAGTGHDIWTGGSNAPRVMQFAKNEDFELDVKFESVFGQKNQAQGILIEADAQNFLRYNFLHDGDSYRLQAFTFTAGAPTTRINDLTLTITPPMYLRVKRIGSVWNLYYSTNGTTWAFAAGFQHDMVVSAYGPYIANSSKDPATVGLIDYFFNSKSPIVPEDNDRKLTVAIDPVGAGSVARNPVKENYACDEPVTLTPVPNTGFKFDHWSGDLTGTANPGALVMNATKNVTAHFVTDVQYTLTVSANGAGAVAKSPDKPAYSAGESVTLTATPAVGNLFTGWSGDATGTTNPLTVVVNGNMTIAGNFAAAPARTLTITVNGPGGVTKNPDKATYFHGETVTLTAVPGAGASFIGWGGALTGTLLQQSLVMDGDKTVTATFAENVFTLTLSPNANGTIAAVPAKPAYYAGEQVTLTATPNSGFRFVAWGGDLSGSANPATLVMTKNSTVTATFVADANYTVTVTTVGSGVVVKTPDKPTYGSGEQLTLTAFPGAGAEFVGWSGDVTGNENPKTITVNGNMAITATFAAAGVYSLTIVPPTNGTIEVNPVRTLYAPGEQVTLTAQPALGYIFSAWGNDATGITNPLVLTMDGNKVVSAVFEVAPIYNVAVAVAPGEDSLPHGTVAVDPEGTQFTAGTQITLTATADTGYAFAGWTGDLVSNKNPYVLTVNSDKSIFANFTDAQGVVSDDFDGCGALNSDLWTWVDPLGQAEYELTGSQLKITVPPEVNYEIWKTGNNSARMMQSIANTNFALVVKIDSPVTETYQTQGVLIEASPTNFIRADFLYDGTQETPGVQFFVGTVNNGQGRVRIQVPVVDPQDEIYMLIRRTGDAWKFYYSSIRTGPWTGVGGFNYGLPVQSVGVFVASTAPRNTPQPGHTALFDFFFNETAPITPEDANAPAITVTKVGQGTVTATPAGPTYTCGQRVQLRAAAATGWRFQNWSVDLNGVNPIQTLVVNRRHNVTATFIQPTSFDIFLPMAIR
ncbi:MAG: InlB B-repeat-containing protein [Candidatus Promineofilum sp.]|nr:InlB B-repeat-containing protein [Promineifilum sp.]MCW5862353.1 DUF1349 domain-containing protein [Anaerolineae bacterium]